jgi:uncharacterized protein
MTMKKVALFASTFSVLAIALTALAADIKQIEWDELLPAQERSRAQAPPAPVHDYLGEGGMAAMQAGSSEVNKTLDGTLVKIPGFIAPIALSNEGEVTEFFLVPYFGACIHVPPPPPNQIVYVKLAKPMPMENMYEAYWITGVLHAKSKGSRLGMASYSMDAQRMEIYKY